MSGYESRQWKSLDEERNDVLCAICKQLEENRKIFDKSQEILGNFCRIIDSRLTTLENLSLSTKESTVNNHIAIQKIEGAILDILNNIVRITEALKLAVEDLHKSTI